jgi:hypothetical protein
MHEVAEAHCDFPNISQISEDLAMTHLKLILGTVCLSALCVCAFGASNASAMHVHECLQEAGTPGGWLDNKCSSEPSATGTWHWKTLQLNLPKLRRPTLTPTTGTSETHAVMHGVIGGISYKITCTGVSSSNSEFENVEPGGVPGVLGHGKLQFTGCSMPEPSGSGCTVPATLETNEMNSSTKEMTTTYKPAAGLEEKVITFTISGCTGGFAALNGSKSVKGSASAVTEESLPISEMFNESSGSSLTFGGQAAQFEAVIHWVTEGGKELALLTP